MPTEGTLNSRMQVGCVPSMPTKAQHDAVCRLDDRKGRVPAGPYDLPENSFRKQLAAALIDIPDRFGHPIQCRVLFDSCSQANFITTKLAKPECCNYLHSPPAHHGHEHNDLIHNSTDDCTNTITYLRLYLTIRFLNRISISDIVPSQQLQREKLHIPKHSADILEITVHRADTATYLTNITKDITGMSRDRRTNRARRDTVD